MYIYSTTQPISNTPVATIPITGWSASSGLIAVYPTTNRLYACQIFGFTKAISILDINAHTVVSQFDANDLTAVLVNPVNHEAYVTVANTSSVMAFGPPGSALPDALKATITISGIGNPTALAVNPVTNKIFVGGSNGISVIGGFTDAVTATLNSGNNPTIGSNFNNLLVNTATNQVISDRAGFWSTECHQRFGRRSETYTVNPASLQVAGGTPLDAGVFDPLANKIYFANINGTAVTVIDGADLTNSYTVTVGQSPTALVLDPGSSQVYVANSNSNFVSVINPGTNSPMEPPTSTVAGGDGREQHRRSRQSWLFRNLQPNAQLYGYGGISQRDSGLLHGGWLATHDCGDHAYDQRQYKDIELALVVAAKDPDFIGEVVIDLDVALVALIGNAVESGVVCAIARRRGGRQGCKNRAGKF